MNHIQFIYIIKLQASMSYYYFLQAPVANFAPLQTIYYIPSQYQVPATSFNPIDSTIHSQVEEKQNYILQSNAATRESLLPEIDQTPKINKKKRVQKVQKDESFGWRNQNKDRNILSNILKAFITHLVERQGMKNYLQYISQRLHLQNGVSDFYKLVQSSFPTTKSYISPKQFKRLLRDPSQPQDFLVALKHLLLRFLRMDYSLILLKSPKIKKRSKLQQMKRSRDLIEALFKS